MGLFNGLTIPSVIGAIIIIGLFAYGFFVKSGDSGSSNKTNTTSSTQSTPPKEGDK